jgi:hypothetical protein
MMAYLEALLVDVDLQVQHVRGLAGLKVAAGIERRRTGDVPGKRPSAGKSAESAYPAHLERAVAWSRDQTYSLLPLCHFLRPLLRF